MLPYGGSQSGVEISFLNEIFRSGCRCNRYEHSFQRKLFEGVLSDYVTKIAILKWSIKFKVLTEILLCSFGQLNFRGIGSNMMLININQHTQIITKNVIFDQILHSGHPSKGYQ